VPVDIAPDMVLLLDGAERGKRAVGRGMQPIQQLLKPATGADPHQIEAVGLDGRNRIQCAQIQCDIGVRGNIAPGVSRPRYSYRDADISGQNVEHFRFRRGRITTGVPPLIAAEVGDLLQAVFAFGAHRKAPRVKKSQKAGRYKELGLVFTHKLESFLTRYQDPYPADCHHQDALY
jgi:hypothetical protein